MNQHLTVLCIWDTANAVAAFQELQLLKQISDDELSVWLSRKAISDVEFATLSLGYSPLLFESVRVKGQVPSNIGARYLRNLELIAAFPDEARHSVESMVQHARSVVNFDLTNRIRDYLFGVGHYQPQYDMVRFAIGRLQELENDPKTWTNERRNLRRLLLALVWASSDLNIRLFDPLAQHDVVLGKLHKRMTNFVSDVVERETFRAHLIIAFNELEDADKMSMSERLGHSVKVQSCDSRTDKKNNK